MWHSKMVERYEEVLVHRKRQNRARARARARGLTHPRFMRVRARTHIHTQTTHHAPHTTHTYIHTHMTPWAVCGKDVAGTRRVHSEPQPDGLWRGIPCRQAPTRQVSPRCRPISQGCRCALDFVDFFCFSFFFKTNFARLLVCFGLCWFFFFFFFFFLFLRPISQSCRCALDFVDIFF